MTEETQVVPNASDAKSLKAYVLSRMLFVKENAYALGTHAHNAVNVLKDIDPEDTNLILRIAKEFVDLLLFEQEMFARLVQDGQQIPEEFDRKANSLVERKHHISTATVSKGGRLTGEQSHG